MSELLDKLVDQIDEKKLIELFIQLISIESPSKNERQIADLLKEKLTGFDIEVYEDQAGSVIQGNTGNIIAKLKGNHEGRSILLSAHMDTVVSNRGVQTILENNIIKTDGRTILGGDDKAGIAIIMEAIRMLKESNKPHGDIYVFFTIAEEIGLYGSGNLDFSRINVEMGFVLDSGFSVGKIIVSAPTEVELNINIYGKSAHSGINPEDGINAIQVAGKILAKISLGRLDQETTANIGIISGGSATNIVPEVVEMQGEVRSLNEDKLEQHIRIIENTVADICKKENAKYEIKKNYMYNSFRLAEEAPVVRYALAAARKLNFPGFLESSGGGSDANIFNQRGIPCVNLGIGVQKEHTNEEFIKVDDMVNSLRLLLAIIDNVMI